MKPVGALPPTWLSDVIDTVLDQGDPMVIAQVVANSPQVIDAIKRGLANKPRPGVMGVQHSLIIAGELKDVFAAA